MITASENLVPLAELPQHVLAVDDALYAARSGTLVPVNYRQTLKSGYVLCDASGDDRVFTLTRSEILIDLARKRAPATRPAPAATRPAAPAPVPASAPAATARPTAPARAPAAPAPRASASTSTSAQPSPAKTASAPSSPRAAANVRRYADAAAARALADAITAEMDRAAAEGVKLQPHQALFNLRKRGLVPPDRGSR
jgi:hypothetical protein